MSLYFKLAANLIVEHSTDAQSTLYSVRNRTLVLTDWMKVKIFGRYVEPFHICILPVHLGVGAVADSVAMFRASKV